MTKTELEKKCAHCGAPATLPALAGPPSACGPCWAARTAATRDALKEVKGRRVHRNALASEYVFSRGETTVGRLILFRDGLGLCVRFMTALNGASEVLLEDHLRGLIGSWPHEYLDVQTIEATFKEDVE